MKTKVLKMEVVWRSW